MKSEIAKVKAKNPTMVMLFITNPLFFWKYNYSLSIHVFERIQDHKEAFKVAAGNWAKSKK